MDGQTLYIWHISEIQTLLFAETNRLKQQLDKLTFLLAKFQTRLHENCRTSNSKIFDCAIKIELLEDKQQLKPVKQVYHYHKWLRNGGMTSLLDLFLIVNSRKQVFPDNYERTEVLLNCFYLLETFLKCLIFFVLHPEMIFLIDSIIFECACSNEQLLKVFKISYDQPTVKL